MSIRKKTETKPRVLYVSMQMQTETWKRLFSASPCPPSLAAQKYHSLTAKGLARAGADVVAVTPPPVSRTTSKRRFVRLRPEEADGISYRYLPIVDLPVVRHAVIWLSAFFAVLFRLSKSAYVLCDALIVTASSGARAAAKLARRPAVAIVTDVPEILGGGSRVSKFNMRELARYDGYVLLTAAMSARVNPNGRPYIVAEGLVDADLANQPALSASAPAEEKICLYAGMLHEKYGILRLARAFSMVEDASARLHIYGTGDAVHALRALAASDPRICCFGVRDNAYIVSEERRATLLINPRPTDELFTRYSFPSKNLEYMASGTPVLTTRLPGMPAEYEPYVYLFDGETPEKMAETLRTVLALPERVRREKGMAARGFVLEHKNNVHEAKRILTFFSQLDRREALHFHDE